MTKKADLNAGISKRHDVDLWAEIRTCYESKSQPNYQKIKDILCVEFNLDAFPSKSTVQRRAVKNEWKRFEDETTVKLAPNKYSADFWLCVRRIHESNPKLTHKRLKELVQNELQCNDFPSHDVVASKAEHEGWERADALLKKSDSNLKKLSRGVNKITSVEEFEGFISSLEDDEDQEFEHSEVPQEVYQFDFIKELVEDEKRNIKNLLMTAQVRRKKQAEVIVKSRKRIALNNEFGDQLSDKLIMLTALLTSDKIKQYFTKPMMRELKDQLTTLSRISETYNSLSFNKRENIKFELNLYGVQLEDLKDVDDAKRTNDLNDDTAYDAQRKKLAEQREQLAARRRYIDSGGLEEDVNSEIERRMNEAQVDDDGMIEEGEFEEIG